MANQASMAYETRALKPARREGLKREAVTGESGMSSVDILFSAETCQGK
jgi:hypothetical protein